MPARSKDADLALAAVLRRLRDERGESQEELGHKARLTAGSLSRIELAQADPGWSKVLRIINGLDVTLVELAEAVERERS
jgi:transcriptional regulator with XRE-family HTH domain